MPIKLPDNLPEAHEVIRNLELENAVLKIQADHSVGGFLRTNFTEKVLLGIVAALVTIFGGGSLIGSWINNDKIHQVEKKQETAAAQVSADVKDVGTDVKRVGEQVKPLVYMKPPQAPDGKWLPAKE